MAWSKSARAKAARRRVGHKHPHKGTKGVRRANKSAVRHRRK